MPLADSNVLYRAIPSKLKLSAPEKRTIKSFAQILVSQIAPGRSFTCLITCDSALQDLNRSFLGHDYPTDVLSFPAAGAGVELGDIAISIERAAAQSESFGHNLLDELRVLMLHGFLHLTGMDHERDRGAMARAERKWRTTFGLVPTLISRSPGSARLVKAAL
jgi:probable rRNA maturation factor